MPRARSQFGLVVLTGAAILLFSLSAFSVDRTRTPLEDRLLASYKDKPQILEGLYCGKKLKFDADAKFLGGGQPGPWTVCGDLNVEDIEVTDREIRIKARRIYLFYDPSHKAFRDAELMVSEKEKVDKSRAENLRFEIRLAQPTSSDETAIRSSLEKLFRRADADFSDITPDYWKPFLEDRARKDPRTIEQEDKPLTTSWDPGNPQFKNMTPPHIVSQPDPEFSKEARQYRFQGTVVVKLLIDKEGKPKEIRITHPLGLGQDEKAVEAIRKWKFKPAVKDGNPVEAFAAIEVKFRLY
jgi:TonB family protein